MKILIVANKTVKSPGEYYDLPLGLAYVSAALKGRGFQVDCLNLNHHQDHFRAFLRAIKDTQADVVCLGGLSAHYIQVEEMLKLLRKHAPGVISIVGGGLITSEPEIVYDLLSPDYGVIGEGEITISELIRALEQGTNVEDVDGVIFRDSKSGQLTITNPRKPIKNIDQIDFPDFDGFEIEQYLDRQRTNDIYYFHALDSKPRMLPIISSRGCPYNCSFCFHPLGRSYRERSLDNFFAELELLISRYNVNFFCVYDELLSANKKRTYELCERMETYGIKWMTQLRVDSVDEELLRALKRSGAVTISYGIESASNSVLKSMKKAITIEQVECALDLTQENRIGIQGNIIFGDRAETKESVAQSFGWYEGHSQYLLGLGMISSYPGSPLYHFAKETDRIPDLIQFLKTGGGVINVTAMSKAEFNRIELQTAYQSLKAQLKHRINPKQLTTVGKDDSGVVTYEFLAPCPHCQAENSYKDFNVSSQGAFVLMCRVCLQRSYISFQLPKDRALLFFYGLSLRLPAKIGFFLFVFRKRVISLSNYTLRQNLTRIGRFIIKSYGSATKNVRRTLSH